MEKFPLRLLYHHMQLSSDPAFCAYIKSPINLLNCKSGNTPLPGCPCCLQSDYTSVKLEEDLVCVFKKWQRSREIRMTISSNIVYCTVFVYEVCSWPLYFVPLHSCLCWYFNQRQLYILFKKKSLKDRIQEMDNRLFFH